MLKNKTIIFLVDNFFGVKLFEKEIFTGSIPYLHVLVTFQHRIYRFYLLKVADESRL